MLPDPCCLLTLIKALNNIKNVIVGALPHRPSYPPQPPVVNAFVCIIGIKLINGTWGFPRAGHKTVLL